MKTFFYTAPVILLLVSGAAQAAEDSSSDLADQSLPTIYVDGILSDDIRLTPGAANSLTSAEIERLRAYSLHDPLDFIPGVRTNDDDIPGLVRRLGYVGRLPGARARPCCSKMALLTFQAISTPVPIRARLLSACSR